MYIDNLTSAAPPLVSDYAAPIRPTRSRRPSVGRVSRRRNPTSHRCGRRQHAVCSFIKLSIQVPSEGGFLREGTRLRRVRGARWVRVEKRRRACLAGPRRSLAGAFRRSDRLTWSAAACRRAGVPWRTPLREARLRAAALLLCGSRAGARTTGDADSAPRARWRTAPSFPLARRCPRNGTDAGCPLE